MLDLIGIVYMNIIMWYIYQTSTNNKTSMITDNRLVVGYGCVGSLRLVVGYGLIMVLTVVIL